DLVFTKKKDVDANYIKLLTILLSKEALDYGTYPEIATHDRKIINWTIDYVKAQKIPADKFEFQMLYGIRRELQEKLVKQGYRMRVYLPYGDHWYPYFMRRLAERPANLWFLLKNLFRR
ncbi:MAG TPA: proline dehydrogenase, partial [Candidatus Scalindua sp.]|nr:proline dehydrogenase [Candidatus Scalindua sp.]